MVIVSITGPSMKEAVRQMRDSSRYADLFELRCDLIAEPRLPELFLKAAKDCIVTCRTRKEGGRYVGSERDRLAFFMTAAFLGARYVDIELISGLRFIRAFKSAVGKAELIVSKHYLGAAPRDVGKVYSMLAIPEADIIKCAYAASDAHQMKFARDFLSLALRKEQKAIAIAMGECGEASRVLYRVWGGWGTFASAEQGAASAAGQLPASVLKNTFHTHLLTRSTKVYGVIGNPLHQSKGVFLHNPLFQETGTNRVYCRFPVRNLRRFMDDMAPSLAGFSVTIPHKEKIIPLLPDVDKTARAIGAVNTVLRKGNRLVGTNCDAAGALDAIERRRRVNRRTVLILGAGGAARAIAYEAKKRGARVVIANRTKVRGERLARDLDVESVPLLKSTSIDFDILVNATSIGMFPDANATPLHLNRLTGKVVFDAVYNPPRTRFLREAERSGARVISGVEMYLNQASAQSTLYTGRKPSLRLMKSIMKI